MAAITIPNSFVALTKAEAAKVNQNFTAVKNWIDGNAVHADGSVAMTGLLTLPASDPTTANQATRKSYVDALALVRPRMGAAAVVPSRGAPFNAVTTQAVCQAFSFSGTTDAVGYLNFSYPTPFSTGIITALAVNGDGAMTGHMIVTATTLTTMTVRAIKMDGNAAANTAIRIECIVFGW